MSGMVVKTSAKNTKGTEALPLGPYDDVDQGDESTANGAKKGTGGTKDKLQTFMGASDHGPATTTAGPYIKEYAKTGGPAGGLQGKGDLFTSGDFAQDGGYNNGMVYSQPNCNRKQNPKPQDEGK